MATNLCAECGTRLPRPEYKTHMQQVHGMQVMDDSDDELSDAARQQKVGADEAPRPQRQRRGRHPAQTSDSAGPEANGTPDAAVGGTVAGAEIPDPSPAPQGGGRSEGRRNRRSGRSRRTARSASGEAGEQGGTVAPAGEFPCSECDRAFASPQGLMRHTNAKHPGTAAAEAATAAAAAAAASQPPVRRGGRPRRVAAAPAAELTTDGAANTAAAQQPAVVPVPIGNRAPYTINDGTVMLGDRQRPRPRRSRGASRGAAPPAAPEAPTGTEADEAAASAAAAAALGGSPTSVPANSSSLAEARPARLVTLFCCKICEQGFKSKNRARAHVVEGHQDVLPAAAAEGSPAGQEGVEVPADGQLELVQVTARRAPRSQGRRGLKPAGPASAAAADSNGEANTSGGDAAAVPTQSRTATGVRRRSRPRRRNTAATGAADAAANGARGGADTTAAAVPSGDVGGGRGEGRVPEDLAALGIVAAS